MTLDPRCTEAINLAKRALGEGESLGVGLLLEALYSSANLVASIPTLEPYLSKPAPRAEKVPESVPVAEDLRPELGRILPINPPLGPHEFFLRLAATDAGRSFLLNKGVPPDILAEALHLPSSSAQMDELPSKTDTEWRNSTARRRAIEVLSPYGRILTTGSISNREPAEFGEPLKALVRTLSRMRRRNAIVIGHPGTGKSALVYELARRMSSGEASLPPSLRSHDIFELSPAFLRSGASLAGEYEERVKTLLKVLEENPRIILFIDEIHSIFQSGVHVRGPFTEANESFKAALGKGTITCLGCTTLSEFRHFIEPDQALVRRFAVITLPPPSAETAVAILNRRLLSFQSYYSSVSIDPAILPRVVSLTDEHLPSRMQPDKSIQLLDDACAYCITAQPAIAELSEEILMRVLEDTLGKGFVRSAALSENQVYASLSAKILGQDQTLREISRAFVSALGGWKRGKGPRGTYIFGGPTGVGKTETAVQLAGILGGGTEKLIRIDCNTLQGSWHDHGPMLNRLLGVPPGYVGYARGQGGILSRIRDLPECIVLFDELEKAQAGLGKLLLQVFDTGRVEDVEGNILDFRRAFLIMTTNLGCTYDVRQLGFTTGEKDNAGVPTVGKEELYSGLRQVGYGEEFLGRISHTFLFRGLEGEAVRAILVKQIGSLRALAEQRGLKLEWSDRLLDHLLAQWQPRFGARHLGSVLSNRVMEQIGVAEAHGEMRGVSTIQLDLLESGESAPASEWVGLALRERRGGSLIIRIR